LQDYYDADYNEDYYATTKTSTYDADYYDDTTTTYTRSSSSSSNRTDKQSWTCVWCVLVCQCPTRRPVRVSARPPCTTYMSFTFPCLDFSHVLTGLQEKQAKKERAKKKKAEASQEGASKEEEGRVGGASGVCLCVSACVCPCPSVRLPDSPCVR
jgi:hypothetical protein